MVTADLGGRMNYLTMSVALVALLAFIAPDRAEADLTLPTPDAKEIFDDHDNPAPQPCHPALFHEAYVKSGFRGWGPWGATNEVRIFLGPSDQGTPITYSDQEDPPFSCEDELAP